jgi:hypothetical protein
MFIFQHGAKQFSKFLTVPASLVIQSAAKILEKAKKSADANFAEAQSQGKETTGSQETPSKGAYPFGRQVRNSMAGLHYSHHLYTNAYNTCEISSEWL